MNPLVVVSVICLLAIAALLFWWRYRHLQLALAQVAVAGCMRRQSGRFCRATPGFLQLLGASALADWLAVLAADDREWMTQQWQDHPQATWSRDCYLPDQRWLRITSSAFDVKTQWIAVQDITDLKVTHQGLAESEQRFARLFYLLPALATITDLRDGRFIDVNDQWQPIFGHGRDEVIGHTSIELNVWASLKDRQQVVDAVLREGAIRGYLFQARHKDGHLVDCEVSGSLIELQGARYLFLIIRDITEELRTARALKESERQLRAMFEQSFQMIALLAADGRLLLANQAAEALFDFRIDSSGQRYCWEMPGLPPARRPLLQHALLAAASGKRLHFEETLASAQGERVVDISLQAFASENHPRGYLLFEAQDVTELKRSEQALRESENKFSNVFRNTLAPQLVSRIDDGFIIEVNQAWLNILKRSYAEVVGHTSVSLGIWVEPAERTMIVERIKAGFTVDGFEHHLRDGNGDIRVCRVACRRMEINGEDCLIWGMQDITEQRAIQQEVQQLNASLEARVAQRTQALETANRELAQALATLQQAQDELVRSEKLSALGSLVAGIAHELNTPIGNAFTVATALVNHTQGFRQEVTSGVLRRSSLEGFLENAETGSDLLMRNLAQARELIASFKQVAVDRTSDQRRQFDLAQLVQEILKTFQPTLRKQACPVDVQLELAPDVLMDSYPGPLGQVLSNFIGNALLHAFEGREHGQLSIHSYRLDGERVALRFADDGVGIPPENQRRVFDPFYTTKLGQGGSGLGLHIVFNIVTQVLGGTIQLESVPGQGCTFILELPRQAPLVGKSAQ